MIAPPKGEIVGQSEFHRYEITKFITSLQFVSLTSRRPITAATAAELTEVRGRYFQIAGAEQSVYGQVVSRRPAGCTNFFTSPSTC